jgi:uncharacterized lipoprotein YddW (UPF0748 family)
MFKKSCILLLLILISSCSIFNSIPQPEREFRGFWVATVVNIDWPKKGNDDVDKKKSDFLKILNFYQDLNFNAAIVQVRTAGDAFYKSDFAPWSRFLTGKEGKPLNTEEDLLQWMIDETHSRGMEFHAWLNPYRATFDLKTEVLSTEHDYNRHPEWMLKYGKKYYYDPGLPEVQEHMVSIIDEIVTNYDIDAIHYDDYFYPYTIKGEVFQDSISFYNCGLPDQSLADWRRSNIDSLIEKSHDIIKKRKPWVQFGVSPFGVWKNSSTDPKGSDTKAGQTTYDDLYADPLLWMEKGWLDYIIPQVYWSMDLPAASHRKILDWWSNNTINTNLYIGNGPYKIRNNSDKSWDNKKELPDQISYAREKTIIDGNAFFSAKSLMANNNDVVKHLKKRFYKRQVLPPHLIKSGNYKKQTILLQSLEQTEDHTFLNFRNVENMRYAMVYTSGNTVKSKYHVKKFLTRAFIKNEDKIHLQTELIKQKKHLAFIFVDKFGHESEPKIIHLKQTN